MQLHLKINNKDISPYVLLPGDLKRVNYIGKFLNDFRIIADNREFRIGVGTYQNRKITVCSTGIGGPSTAIAVEELINAGAKYLVRVGTCGGAWRKEITLGSTVIPTAAVRDEGTTDEYILKGFPAVANFDLVQKLVVSAQKNSCQYFVGINRSHDAFYGSVNSITKWGDYLLDGRWKNFDTPILSSDMECATLFVIASLKNVAAAAILAVNANPELLCERVLGKELVVATEVDEGVTKNIIDKTIQVALQALSTI
ncbi:MAG: Uridine phosphorylase [Candidatus Magasanikbacteria bacterium GW2011_GWC2_34_16]|uniref:Uridine phosphorylase n=2 Tax=Candidatus Magasanikiibacteriota TaxID=1752731 RepID=A0A0G0HKV7_9BACT|nr:MAG: Uridine phosphorylase [Candidatus Magasanikbacteria bacterium GW2011_GWC2_34_16]KKQ39185.1 MAG: Uridine phosphorylase [Candidatus Magasanikbacteria bacterium GW2011_GWA2_37_8]